MDTLVVEVILKSEAKATVCGLFAIALWCTAPGLIRSLSQLFSPLGGAALMYTLGALLLVIFLGRPHIRQWPRAYLIVGSALFVAYEMCLSLSLGYAQNSTQAIELGVVNYLWPCLTVMLAIAMNGQKARWIIVPGSACALFGILWVVSGDGLAVLKIVERVSSNPLSYSLSLSGALIFALYCNVTRRYAAGQNGVAFFFTLTAIALWIKYGFSDQHIGPFTVRNTIELIAAAASMAGGYALWNIGILRGNLTLLATVSYFAPVFSSAFAAAWLGTVVTMQFWQGAVFVTVGSLICWAATRRRTVAPER